MIGCALQIGKVKRGEVALNSGPSFKPGTRPHVFFPLIAWSFSAACGVSMGGEAAQNSFIKVNLQAARAASQIFVFLSLTGLAGKLLLPSENILDIFITIISCFN